MEFVEALQDVLDAASQPKQYPPGVTPVTLPGVSPIHRRRFSWPRR